MNRVTLELWLWLSQELKSDFECPSEMRSVKTEEVKQGMTFRQWMRELTGRYPSISKKVFDVETQCLYPDVVMNYNDRVVNPPEVYDRILRDGDRITLLPLAGGG